jgi:hypothetical protein
LFSKHCIEKLLYEICEVQFIILKSLKAFSRASDFPISELQLASCPFDGSEVSYQPEVAQVRADVVDWCPVVGDAFVGPELKNENKISNYN